MKKKRLNVVDLFCGAGGTSGGVYEAGDELGEDIDLVAINHWDIAIATHRKNHSSTRHICETIESVRPRQVIPGGYLDLLVASPECTHHSTARGGVPMSEQSRATAWSVLTWAQHLYIRELIVENVPEFENWGPLGKDGRPLKNLRGETFKAWMRALESLGYKVEYRVLCTADYGDPTERRRLFVRARRGGGDPRWPTPTHDEFCRNGLLPWKTFEKDVWDRKVIGKSIFNRAKPLATKTLMRIGAGIEEFGGFNITKFLVKLNGTGRHRTTRLPVPTITAGGKRLGLVELRPFLIPQGSRGANRSNRGVPTITTTARGIGWCQPYLVPNFGERPGQKPRFHRGDKPVPAVTSHGAGGVVESFVFPVGGRQARARSGDRTLGTILGRERFGVIQPFMVDVNPTIKWGGKKRVRSGKRPVKTLLTRERLGVCEPIIVPVTHAGKRANRSGKQPLQTVTGARRGELGMAEAFLVQFNGSSKYRRTNRPIGSLTTKHRYAIVKIGRRRFGLEILFRMLTWRELARAMSFPDDFQFVGTDEQKVKQIGNAVPRKMARALAREALRRR